MDKHFYDIVNADGDLLLSIASGYTNLDRETYSDKYLSPMLPGWAESFGERVFVTPGGE